MLEPKPPCFVDNESDSISDEIDGTKMSVLWCSLTLASRIIELKLERVESQENGQVINDPKMTDKEQDSFPGTQKKQRLLK